MKTASHCSEATLGYLYELCYGHVEWQQSCGNRKLIQLLYYLFTSEALPGRISKLTDITDKAHSFVANSTTAALQNERVNDAGIFIPKLVRLFEEDTALFKLFVHTAL